MQIHFIYVAQSLFRVFANALTRICCCTSHSFASANSLLDTSTERGLVLRVAMFRSQTIIICCSSQIFTNPNCLLVSPFRFPCPSYHSRLHVLSSQDLVFSMSFPETSHLPSCVISSEALFPSPCSFHRMLHLPPHILWPTVSLASLLMPFSNDFPLIFLSAPGGSGSG
jgi:hypothetical protein